jgi:acyl-homoserine lactone synthase
MLHVIKGFDSNQSELLKAAFRFRYAAFVEEAGWDNLRRSDGLEIDQFDTPATIHVVATKNGEVSAYSRLNPTTKPHLLSEVYPHLASRGLVREESAWEWSRMGTSKKFRSDGYGWNSSIGIICRCVTIAAINHDIETLVWQAHPVWISRAGELGFDPQPLGLPAKVGSERVVAVKMAVSLSVLECMDVAGVPAFPVDDVHLQIV